MGRGLIPVKSVIIQADYADGQHLADTLLHELLHLDLAADSVMGTPNPQIRDLSIRYKIVNDENEEVSSPLMRAYGPKHAKILARFQPISPSLKQTGYFVQRNDDNLALFALANYVQKELKRYPYAPIVYNRISDAPWLPDPREYSVVFSPDVGRPVSFINHTIPDSLRVPATNENGDVCSAFSEDDKGEGLKIGAPNAAKLYPRSYWDQRQQWLKEIKTSNVCLLHVRQIWTCESVEKNLYASIRLEDARGKVVFNTPESTHSIGLSINDQDPLELKGIGLKNSLRITGEHTGDYIQFMDRLNGRLEPNPDLRTASCRENIGIRMGQGSVHQQPWSVFIPIFFPTQLQIRLQFVVLLTLGLAVTEV